jgi:hypothetical protein
MRMLAMRRLFSPIALTLVLGASACATSGPHFSYDDGAQTTTYFPVSSQPRSQADLQAARQACDGKLRRAEGGYTPAEFRQCMLAQGFRYGYALQDGEYPDPDPNHAGMVCHDIVVLGVVGSSCSN